MRMKRKETPTSIVCKLIISFCVLSLFGMIQYQSQQRTELVEKRAAFLVQDILARGAMFSQTEAKSEPVFITVLSPPDELQKSLESE